MEHDKHNANNNPHPPNIPKVRKYLKLLLSANGPLQSNKKINFVEMKIYDRKIVLMVMPKTIRILFTTMLLTIEQSSKIFLTFVL